MSGARLVENAAVWLVSGVVSGAVLLVSGAVCLVSGAVWLVIGRVSGAV